MHTDFFRRFAQIMSLIIMIIINGCGLERRWKVEIEMADGESIVEIIQSGYRLCIGIGLKNGDDRDVILIEDINADIHSFWLSLPHQGNNDIYILDKLGLVKDIKCKQYSIHIVREYIEDPKTYHIDWMDPEMKRSRDTYYICPSLQKIKKEPIE